MSWLGCTRQCKKNATSYSTSYSVQHHIQNQSKFLPLYLINGSEYTVQNILISLNTLSELHMKSKKQVKYQQNLLLKKGKAIITETLHLVTNVFEDDNFSRQVLEKKGCVSVSKEYINNTFGSCKSLCNLQEFYTPVKEKHPNVNIGFAKFCAQKMTGSKMNHFICVFSAYQSLVLLVDVMD